MWCSSSQAAIVDPHRGKLLHSGIGRNRPDVQAGHEGHECAMTRRAWVVRYVHDGLLRAGSCKPCGRRPSADHGGVALQQPEPLADMQCGERGSASDSKVCTQVPGELHQLVPLLEGEGTLLDGQAGRSSIPSPVQSDALSFQRFCHL